MLRRPLTNDFNSRRLPTKRSLQSLLTSEQMNIAIQRESARADRNGGEFALVLFRAKSADRQALSSMRLARTVLKRVRATDDLGWFDDQHIAALLPDTSAAGAWRFADQVCMMLSRKAPRPLCSVYCYPTKWFSGDDDSSSDGNGNGKLLSNSNSNGNGHANGNGHDNGNGHNGSGNGNGNGNGKLLSNSNSNGNGHANGNGHDNGNGHNGSGNGNGNGNGLSRGVEIGAADRPLGVGNVIPYFLDGVRSGENNHPAPVHRLENLLVRPLPRWKRTIDIIGAMVGLILASPILLVAALLIKYGSKGPVIFTQQRAGLGGRPFTIYKFRTMVVDAEEQKAALRKFSEQDGPAFKLTNDPRITRVGRFLRKTSIDELPQLWNVLMGDMTLVGPRPLPVGESDACEQWHRRRLDVTPGLTCIWQVKGRSKVSFSEWVRMDVAYIRRRTFFNDMRILFETVPAVLLRKGAR
jgi:lipopolysaccharide/colanic/teichoic acid biosynthesis glycosyltransferase